MDNFVCLDKNYSTTRLSTKEKPALEQKPVYKLAPRLFLSEAKDRQGEGGLRTGGYFKKSHDNKPLISVVTVVYNGEKHLEQTINSVLDQSYGNVEYIIIDGGSTDGTLEIIEKYEDKIDYWVSEADSGIYDAMNKGISLCTGDYIAFLNADDWYPENSIELVVNASIKLKPDYIFGDMDLYNENVFVGKRKPYKYKYGTPIGHQAFFVKTSLMKENPFDIAYKMAADYDFMIKLIKTNHSYIQVNKSLANFRITGTSSISNLDQEYFMIYKEHFGLLEAIMFYVRNTKQPFISSIVQSLVKIKKLAALRKNKNV